MSKTGLDDYFAAGGTELDLLNNHVHDVLPEPPDDEAGTARKESQATALVALAVAGCELFAEAGGDNAYATVTAGEIRKTLPLRGKAYRQWLSQHFYDRHKKAAGGQALHDALTTLAGIAAHEGTTFPVFVRLAECDGELWLDLGDDTWDAVRITPDGWEVVASAAVPVKFRRPRGLLPLPLPDSAGDLGELATFTNRGDDDDRDRLMLAAGFLVGLFQLTGGRAVLELLGEAGSGKTRLGQMLRAIVDPNLAPLRTVPRDEGDLVIAAMNGILCAFDNASELRESMSDAFCRLTTGAGIGKRELYSDGDEVILNAQRPVLLTGITSVVTRGDLGSRTMTIELPRIEPAQRLTDAAIDRAFEQARPRLLGGLLHAVASALKHRETVHLPEKPRLADFVEWVEAAGPALGWEPGEFAAVFAATRRDADVTAIEALPIGPVVLRLVRDRDRWTGTGSDLLAELVRTATDDERKESGWPKSANRLSQQLRRLSPNLRQVGVWIMWERSGAGRTITLEKNPEVWNRHHRHDRHGTDEDPREDANTTGDGAPPAHRHQSTWEPPPSSPDRLRTREEPEPLAKSSSLNRAKSWAASPDIAGAGDEPDDGDVPTPTFSDGVTDDGEATGPAPFGPPAQCDSTVCHLSGKCCFPGLCGKDLGAGRSAA